MAIQEWLVSVFAGTVGFSSEITTPSSFTAECAENAEALEKPSGVWNYWQSQQKEEVDFVLKHGLKVKQD